MFPRCVAVFAAVLVVSLSVNFATSSSISSAMSAARVNVAACRARCLNQIAPEIYKDVICETNPNCNMCWKTCDMFYSNFTVWGPMCDERQICFPGCQVSCAFYRSRRDSAEQVDIAKEQWNMDPIQFQKKSLQEELLIEWTRPERLDQIDSSRLVYVVMLKVSNRWVEIGQTIQTSMVAEDYRYTQAPTYISLLAYSDHGLVAERTDVYKVDINDVMYGDQYMPEPPKMKERVQLNASPSVSRSTYGQRWTLYLASLTTKQTRFGVEATIMWEKSTKCESCKYEVSWKAQDSRQDVVGTLYTTETIATVILWPGYVHIVRVKCLDAKGAIRDATDSLNVDTNFAHVETVKVSRDQGSACKNTFILEVLVVAMSVLGVVLLVCLVICLFKIFRQRKVDSDAKVESGKPW